MSRVPASRCRSWEQICDTGCIIPEWIPQHCQKQVWIPEHCQWGLLCRHWWLFHFHLLLVPLPLTQLQQLSVKVVVKVVGAEVELHRPLGLVGLQLEEAQLGPD